MSPSRYFVNPWSSVPAASLVESIILKKDSLKTKISEFQSIISLKLEPSSKNCDGGIYVGLGGVAYAYWYIQSRFGGDPLSGSMIEAQKLVNYHVAYVDKHKSDVSAFFLGGSGVYATGALIYNALGDSATAEKLLQKFAHLYDMILPLDFLPHGGDEMLVGRAGYLCGVLNLRRKLGVPVINDEQLHQLCLIVVESGRRYAQRHHSPCPLMYAYHGTEYLGAAHGLAGILQVLISFPTFLKSDTIATKDIKQTVDYVLGVQQSNGNWAPAMDEVGNPRSDHDELVHWCHGAPGVIYLFARAFLVWNEQKYLDACVRAGDLIWQKGLLKKGPGVCHGIAGNGYAFLLLYQLTNDESYLVKAFKFADFMDSEEFMTGARIPDTPYSLYEGLAGTLCFYADLCDPKKAEFPWSPVFI